MNTLRDRFIKKVDFGSECWNWKASLNPKGYGQVWVRMMRQPQLAHRISYLLFVGPIPINLCVLHKCDNPKCVRPDHLFLGTMKENSQDMVLKGRCGAKKWTGRIHLHPSSRLTLEQVNEIREWIREEGELASTKRIALRYSVGESAIRDIKFCRTWKPERLYC